MLAPCRLLIACGSTLGLSRASDCNHRGACIWRRSQEVTCSRFRRPTTITATPPEIEVAVLGQEQMVRAGKDDALIAISFAPYRRSPSISPAGQIGAPPAPRGAGFSVHTGPQRQPGRSEGVREHHRQGRHRGERRTDHPNPRHRPRRARCPDLQRVVQPRRPVGRRHRRLPAAGGQRDRGLQRGQGEDGRTR
jgi:hypothetical protein